MNVTIKINDKLCRDARHRAVDAGLSLSGWIADIIRKELASSSTKESRPLLETLGNERLAKVEIDFKRDNSPARQVDFS